MSLIVSPTHHARTAFENLLKDPVTGFNPVYVAAMSNHPGAPPMSIDFIGTMAQGKSKNFFRGDVDPTSLEDSSIFQYPLLSIYGIAGASSNLQKFQRFAGLIRLGARFLLSGAIYDDDGVPAAGFEVWPDCVEDAFLNVIQSKSAEAAWPASSSVQVVYNGLCSYDRKAPFEGASNWLQILTFSLNMDVIIA